MNSEGICFNKMLSVFWNSFLFYEWFYHVLPLIPPQPFSTHPLVSSTARHPGHFAVLFGHFRGWWGGNLQCQCHAPWVLGWWGAMPLSYPRHLGASFKPGDVAQERWIYKKPKRRGMEFWVCFFRWAVFIGGDKDSGFQCVVNCFVGLILKYFWCVCWQSGLWTGDRHWKW